MILTKKIQVFSLVLLFLFLICSCSVSSASDQTDKSSLTNSIHKSESGFTMDGLDYGISENELFIALNLKQENFEKKENPLTKETIFVQHENLPQWEETKENGLIISYAFSEKGQFHRADYQIYWNAKPVFKEDKWMLDMTETDGKAESEKAQQLLDLFSEKYGAPIEAVTLENLKSPDGNITAQWIQMESEEAQGGLMINFYRQTNPFYGNKEIYGADIIVSE